MDARTKCQEHLDRCPCFVGVGGFSTCGHANILANADIHGRSLMQSTTNLRSVWHRHRMNDLRHWRVNAREKNLISLLHFEISSDLLFNERSLFAVIISNFSAKHKLHLVVMLPVEMLPVEVVAVSLGLPDQISAFLDRRCDPQREKSLWTVVFLPCKEFMNERK